MSVGVHCNAKSRWVLEGPSDCQMLFSGVCHQLSGQLFASDKADICANSYLFECHFLLTPPSVRCQKWFSEWYSWWGGLHRTTTRFCYL